MEKKNQYGVQIGDIFNRRFVHKDKRFYSFYQVVALRGKTQVVVREIGSGVIAFDGRYEEVVPIPDAWVSERTLVRQVKEISGTSYIKIKSDWASSAYLEPDVQEYLSWSDHDPNMANCFRKYHPGLAKRFHIEDGTGVYAVDKPFVSMGDDCPALLRYPDGHEEKVPLASIFSGALIQ